MRTGLKAAVVVLPFLLVFLVIRSCGEGEGERWQARAAAIDPAAVLGVDADDLIVVAPSKARAEEAAAAVRGFRTALVENYGALLGVPRRHRMVIVLFSNADQLREYAGGSMVHDPERVARIHGYTDPLYGAIFLPAEVERHTLRHETVHWVMDTALGGAGVFSPWLNEGLAQLFEPYDPAAGESPGIARKDRLLMRLLMKRDVLDVDRLLDLQDYRSFVVDDGTRNYLEALVLTAFLFHARPRKKLEGYVRLERSSPEGRAEAFRRIYGSRDESFRRDLSAFIRDTKEE